MGIRSDIHDERKRENTLQTVAIVGGLGLILATIGWLIAGILGIIVALVLVLITAVITPRIGPALIFRYYRARPLTPQTSPGLYRMLVALSQRAGLETVPQLYYIPSPMHNAFATGVDDRAAIGITDGILRQFNGREIAGILAHEISHIKHRDTQVMALADTMNRLTATASQLAFFFLLISFPVILVAGASISWLSVLILLAAPSAGNLLQLGLSRTREYAADLEAARLTGDPHGLASALGKLERLTAGRWEQVFLPGRRVPEPSLLRTHPPTKERIHRLLELKPEPQPTLPDVLRSTLRPSHWHHPATLSPRPTWHLSGLWY